MNVDYSSLLEVLCSGSGDTGVASADLAQHIWSGDISEDSVLQLLQHDNDLVRAAVAWAVADNRQPVSATEWLAKKGVSDSCDKVRYWAVQSLIEIPQNVCLVEPNKLLGLKNDMCPGVREKAEEIYDGLNDSNGSGLKKR